MNCYVNAGMPGDGSRGTGSDPVCHMIDDGRGERLVRGVSWHLEPTSKTVRTMKV